MSEFRGFVFDIDMTAVPNGASTVQSLALRSAFEALPEDAIAIAATGRSTEAALPITRDLNLKHESVVANGALIIDSLSGEVVWEKLLAEEQVTGVLETCAPLGYQVHLAGDTMESYRTATEQLARTRDVPVMFVKDVPPEVAHDLRERLLADISGMHIYLSPAWGGGKGTFDLNIGNVEAKKHNALLELFGRYAIDGAEMIGVGDGINDVEQFEVVGHRVAVANAHPQLIELADEVVPSQEDDGLAIVVKRFHTTTTAIDPVVQATDRRIRERGLADFKAVIDRMAEDPSWQPPKIIDTEEL